MCGECIFYESEPKHISITEPGIHKLDICMESVSACYGTTQVVFGSILNNATCRPICGATITVEYEGCKKTVKTNRLGQYEFKVPVRIRAISIKIEKYGFIKRNIKDFKICHVINNFSIVPF